MTAPHPDGRAPASAEFSSSSCQASQSQELLSKGPCSHTCCCFNIATVISSSRLICGPHTTRASPGNACPGFLLVALCTTTAHQPATQPARGRPLAWASNAPMLLWLVARVAVIGLSRPPDCAVPLCVSCQSISLTAFFGPPNAGPVQSCTVLQLRLRLLLARMSCVATT